MRIINYIFIGAFTIEALIKILVMSKKYFEDNWNIFDFVVILLSLIGLSLEKINIFNELGTSTSIIRIFRIARLFRIIKRA